MDSIADNFARGMAREAVGEVRAMTTGLLEGRAAQVKRAYPVRLASCAQHLPEHADALGQAAQLLREASELLRVAEGVLSGVLGRLETARRGEAEGSPQAPVVH